MNILDQSFIIFGDTKQFNAEPEVVMGLFSILMKFGFTPSTIQMFDMANPSIPLVKPEFVSQKNGLRIAFLPDRIEFNFLPDGNWKSVDKELNFSLFSNILNEICSKYEILSNRLSHIIRYVIDEETKVNEFLNEKERFALNKLVEWSANRVIREDIEIGDIKETINIIENVNYNSENIVVINLNKPTKIKGIILQHDINTYQSNLSIRFNKTNYIDVFNSLRSTESKINE